MTSTPEQTPAELQSSPTEPAPAAEATPRPAKRPKRGKRVKAANPPKSVPFVPHRVKANQGRAD